MPNSLHPPEPVASTVAPSSRGWVRRPRWRRLIFLVFVAAGFFALGWLCAPAFAPARPSAVDRERALRLADEASKNAHAAHARDAYTSASRARHSNPSLPGMELIVSQMLFNAGDTAAAAAFARTSQKRGDSSPAIAVVLGLEAWSRRGVDPVSKERAYLASRLWLEDASRQSLNDGAPRFFLAEIGRLAGRPEPGAMLSALHRFQPWESCSILDAKMHLAAAEAGSQFNAANLGQGLRLDVSPQARAVKNFRRVALEDADQSGAKRDLASLFAQRHLILLGSDPAFLRAADTGDQRASVSSASREPLPE